MHLADGLLGKIFTLSILLIIESIFSKSLDSKNSDDEKIESYILKNVHSKKIKSFENSKLLVHNQKNNNYSNKKMKKKLLSVFFILLITSVFLTPIITSEDLLVDNEVEKISDPVINNQNNTSKSPSADIIQNEIFSDDECYSNIITIKNSTFLNNTFLEFDIPSVRYEDQIILINLTNNKKMSYDDYKILDSDSNGLFDKIKFEVFSSIYDINYKISVDVDMVDYYNEYSDVLDNNDGTKTAVFYSEPVNYFDKNLSCFKPINTKIKNSTYEDFIFENNDNVFSSYFDDSGLVKFQKNNCWGLSYPINQSFGNLTDPSFEIDDNKIIYHDIYDNIDLRYSIYNNKILEEFILNSPMNISYLDTGLDYHGVYYIFTNNSIKFYNNSTDELLFFIPEPVMWEEKNVSDKNYGLKYEIINDNGSYYLRKNITEEGFNWLNHENRSYPVVIDATWSDNNPIVDGYVSYVDPPQTYTDYRSRNYLEWCNYTYSGTTVVNRSYVEWDISSIAGQDYVIRDVDFYYQGVQNDTGSGAIYSMENSPSSALNPETIFEDCFNGTSYVTSGFPTIGADQQINLGDDAVKNLWAACNNSQTWWAIGMTATSSSDSPTFDKIVSENYSEANTKPTLYVTYDLPVNNPPSINGEQPVNQSTDISLVPVLNVTISDEDSSECNVTWRSNSSGVWQDFGYNKSINTGVSSQNISQINSNFSEYSTKYFWSINCSDGTSWTNETYYFTTEAEPFYEPVINSFDIANSTGSKLNNETGLLSINKKYYFEVNITDKNGWGNIEYLNITSWFDNGNEISFYNQTNGGNLNMFLQYKNTTGTAEYELLWPDDEAEIITNDCSETIVNSTTRIIKIYFKPKNQIRWAESNRTWNTSQNICDDAYSWNFNITVTDQQNLYDYSLGEYGVDKYTFISQENKLLYVTIIPGYSGDTNIISINYSSNYNYIIDVYFEKDLINKSSGQEISIGGNVDILAEADLDDDISTDQTFTGVGETNAIEVINSSGDHRSDGVEQSINFKFNVDVPIGTYSGKYTSRLASRIIHK
jgi:hypothetical protein